MKPLLPLILLFVSTFALAQPGTLDKSYNRESGFTTDATIGNNTIRLSGQQSDGSIITVGYYATGAALQIRAVRYRLDGSLDPNFLAIISGNPTRMIVQPDNKILITGLFPGSILRLNANGTADQQFNTNVGSGATDIPGIPQVNGMALQADGKIVVGGSFTKFNGASRNYIARLNSDGTTDNTFTPGEGADAFVSAVAIQSTGKIIIAGSFRHYNGNERQGIARLNTDGSIDATFNPRGFELGDKPTERILVLPDDRLIIGGSFTAYGGADLNSIARTDADGVYDPGFVFTRGPGDVYDIDLYSNDKIIVSGDFMAPNIARLNISDGSTDNTFKPFEISGAATVVYAADVMDDGGVFICGSFITFNGSTQNGVAMLLPGGSLDGGRGANNAVNTVLHTGGGAAIIGGDFTSFRGGMRNRIAQVTSEGKLNESFDPAEGADGSITAMAQDANGKIIIAGNFTHYRTVARARIARINNDGTLDNTFDPGLGADAVIRSVAIQNDGAILIGGDFSSYDGATRNHIARIESDGDVDPTFDSSDGADGTIQSIAIQSTGKIIAAGSFSNYNSVAQKFITRINTNGTVDNTFDPGNGPDASIYVVKVDDDNNLVVGGSFTVFDGIQRKGLARLTLDGAVDESFDPSETDYRTVRTIIIRSDGSVFIGGDFNNKVALITPTGETDALYYPDVNPNDAVLTSAEDNNGLIIIGGLFTSYDNTNIDRLARVLKSGKRAQTISFAALPDRAANEDNFALSATASSGLPVTFTSLDTNVATVDGNTVTLLTSGTATIVASQSGNENFLAAPDVQRSFTVAKEPQSITFEIDLLLTENATPGDAFNISATASSGLPVTFTSGDTNVATVNGNTVTILHAGNIKIIASQAGNLTFSSAPNVTRSFIVEKQDQSLTFEIDQQVLEHASAGDIVELVATTSSGLPVTFTSGNTNVATVTGTNAKLIHIGTAKIVASQAGNVDYNPATSVQRSFTVVKGTQVITFQVQSQLQDAYPGNQVELTATSSSGLPITYTSSAPVVATVNGNILTVVGAGQTLIAANQAGNTDFDAAVPVGRQLTIVIAGIQDENDKIVAYPNPTDGPVTIQLPSAATAKAYLVNALGVKIDDATQSGSDLKLDLSTLPTGIYFIRIESPTLNGVKRIHRK